MFFDAEFISGTDFILGLAGLENRLINNPPDLIITGEGRIDSQSLSGKLIQGEWEVCPAHLELDVSETLADSHLRDLVKVKPELPIGLDLPICIVCFIGFGRVLTKPKKSCGGVFKELSTQPQGELTLPKSGIIILERKSSLDFFVYCMTRTTVWQRYHEVKQDVLLKIGHVIEENGAAIAFPTRQLEIERAPQFAGLVDDVEPTERKD